MTISRLIDTLTGRDSTASGRTTPPPLPPDVSALEQSSALLFVPSKETEQALGTLIEVRERIAEVLPGVVFDEGGHGAFLRTGYSVAFDTGVEEYVHAVGVQVVGGTAATPPLSRLIEKTGWRLVAEKS